MNDIATPHGFDPARSRSGLLFPYRVDANEHALWAGFLTRPLNVHPRKMPIAAVPLGVTGGPRLYFRFEQLMLSDTLCSIFHRVFRPVAQA
ncbi:hypothetical protein [Calycomorphotria hydatis]|uniref:hypothetical protein n=1 Tax=Calycomorphotria hydatis TaxID=2528027 RepID=UPI0011A51895|nr:hypothetical protein [Calycomorphotria hydatis]